MRPKLILKRILLGIFISLMGLPVANAMPLFARKYGVPCSTCHTTIPRLNETGYKFRAAGFRLLEEIGKSEDKPNYPTEDSKGPHHTISGVLRDISCSYPTVLALTVDAPSGKKTTLYTNNYYKVVFTTANYEPEGDIRPCSGIEDMKATVRFAEVSDKNVAGQILAIELSK